MARSSLAALLDPATMARPATAAAGETPYRALLVLRFWLLNLTGAGLLAAAWGEGWIEPVLAADSTRLCLLILLVFLLGLALAAAKVAMLARELDALATGRWEGSKAGQFLAAIRGRDAQVRANLIGALRLKLAHRIGHVRHAASSLVLLGLIGTVTGFILALKGIDPATADDAGAIPGMVAGLIEGMGVALYTTLVGSVLNIWLNLNVRLLEAGAVHLVSHLIETGERDG